MTFKISPKELDGIRQITIDGDDFRGTFLQRGNGFYSSDGENYTFEELSNKLKFVFSKMAEGRVSILYNNRHTELIDIVDGQASSAGGS